MEGRLFTFDEFLLKLQFTQKLTGIIYYDFKRENPTNPFRFKSMRLLCVAIILMVVDGICNIVKIGMEINANRLSEAKQIGAVFSIELLCLVRGFACLFKYERILVLSNQMDKIFPKDAVLQQRMNIAKIAKYLELRHRVLHVYAICGLSAFIGLPYLRYLVFYDKASGAPLLDEYHQHASWFPYQLKQNRKAYPYIYVYETVVTVFGINCVLTWDQIYTALVVQFQMQFEFVNHELAQLNAKETMNKNESKEFYKRLFEIIRYHQHLLLLGDELRKTFNLPLFITDLVSAASICFHLYLIANSDDAIEIFLFVFPCIIQIAFAFDNCYQGQLVAEASTRMLDTLYEHNWYDGSLEYRKLFKILLQFANNPFTLSGYNLFSIDMGHFRGVKLEYLGRVFGMKIKLV